jgi:Asp-tRNA(Asn)/Glu-tRNA(Gln) amidotransferase A subunit family amidase
MSELTFLSIAEITRGLRAGKFQALDVVEAHLKNIARLQPRLNAFTHIDDYTAIAQAQQADAARRANGPLGPLHGVPVTLKSSLDVANWPCPAGSQLRKDHIPTENAPVVQRLKSAGAILLGNTNAPENLMSYETTNRLQGRTSNPWNREYSAGGSSGGEAAAIGSGCSTGGIGSDGGGSIRVPAHFCGIVGLKPTPGRVPATGHFPASDGAFAWLGVVGPMARTVADVRALFEILRGPDPGDTLSAPIAPPVYNAKFLQELRIGVLDTTALGTFTAETETAVQKSAAALTKRGFHLEPFAPPQLPQALDLWWFFFGPVIAHLSRATITPADEPELSPQFREYLGAAGADPAPTLDQLLKSCVARDRLRASVLRHMANVPILLSPVSSAPAFHHDEGTWLGPRSYRETMRASQWLNLVGFPAISVPITLSNEGLPIGVQLIGRPNEEELLLEVAAQLEEQRGPWPQPKI